MMRKTHLEEHFEDRRKCMNCGNYRNWQEMPTCPCGWPRFKDISKLILPLKRANPPRKPA